MIGKLRDKVNLQKATIAYDGRRTPTKTWATYASVWANIQPLSAREFFEAAQGKADVSHKITIRHRTDVRAKHRATKSDGTVYEFAGPPMDKDQRRAYLEIMAKESEAATST